MMEQNWGRKTVVAALGISLFLGMVWATHALFTADNAGANDFYPRWRGAVLFWQDGVNPYSPAATEAIQRDMYGGRLALPEEDQVLFVYPFYVVFLLLPLAALPLSYAWIQAIWLVVVMAALLGSVVGMLRLLRWQPPLWLTALLLLWAILFYHNARTVILGQFAGLVLLWLVLALLALQNGSFAQAGFWLALTTMKPQMVFLVIPALLLWALGRRQWRFIAGFALTMLVLTGLSFVLLPSWLGDFVAQVRSYPGYTFTGSPLWVLTGYYFPQLGPPVERALSVLLVAIMLWTWRHLLRSNGVEATAVTPRLLVILGITMLVTNMILVRTATTNYIVLTIPLLLVLQAMAQRGRSGQLWVAALLLVGMVGLWALFLATINGNVEHPVMYLPLPLVIALLLIWKNMQLEKKEHASR